MSVFTPAVSKNDSAKHGLSRIFRENGLSLVLFALFTVALMGQSLSGYCVYNQDQRQHGNPQLTYREYLTSAHFFEATFENWESEWLQMAAFVWLAACLKQKGSPESKSLDKAEEVDRRPDPQFPGAPWPVRWGGIWLAIYSRSLTLAFLLLFLASWLLHAASGAREFSQEQLAHGQAGVTMLQFMASSEFWFQSLQNWQSEFLAIGGMVYLAVYLRQIGSPESKPVDAPHDQNE